MADKQLASAPSPSDDPRTGVPAKLSVVEVLRTSFATVVAHRRAYARAAFIPFMFGVVDALVLATLGRQLGGRHLAPWERTDYIVANVILIVVAVMFCTKSCRIVLGPGRGQAPLKWVWRRAEWLWLGQMFRFMLMFGGFGAFLTVVVYGAIGRVIGPWMIGVVLFLVLAVLSRFLFVFPAVAAGHATGLRIAWRQSRGHAWRLTLIYLALLATMAAVEVALVLLGVAALRLTEAAVFVQLSVNFVGRIVAFAVVALFLTGLSVAYARATGFPLRPRARLPHSPLEASA